MRIDHQSGIAHLQREYLKTGDERQLDQLYKEIVILGFYLIKLKRYSNSEEDVYDLASSICARLMETKAEVITSAPSSYIDHALFYKRKPTKWDSMEVLGNNIPCTDFDSVRLQEFQEEVAGYAASIVPEDLRPAVLECINHLVPARVMRATLDKDKRCRFDMIMKEIREYARAQTM